TTQGYGLRARAQVSDRGTSNAPSERPTAKAPPPMNTGCGPYDWMRMPVTTGAIGPMRNDPNQSTLPTRPRRSRGTFFWTAVSQRVPNPDSEKPMPAAQRNGAGNTGTSPNPAIESAPMPENTYIAMPFRWMRTWATKIPPTISPTAAAAVSSPKTVASPLSTSRTRIGSPTLSGPEYAALM